MKGLDGMKKRRKYEITKKMKGRNGSVVNLNFASPYSLEDKSTHVYRAYRGSARQAGLKADRNLDAHDGTTNAILRIRKYSAHRRENGYVEGAETPPYKESDQVKGKVLQATKACVNQG